MPEGTIIDVLSGKESIKTEVQVSVKPTAMLFLGLIIFASIIIAKRI